MAYFSEAQLQELRANLPVSVVTVTDNLESVSNISALSAKQGNILGNRIATLEAQYQAMQRIETVYLWGGDNGIAAMSSIPLDSPNTLANARTAYELKQMLDALGIRVATLESLVAAIGSSSSGGGGTGITASLINGDDYTTITIGVNSATFYTKAQVEAYVAEHGGSGGSGGGYIGTTQVSANSNQGQHLTGVGNGTFSGNVSVGGTLSVTGASTLTGNISTNGTVSLLGSTKRIYFGTEYIELNSGKFHFSTGLYSDGEVVAGGPGTGGGGGGGVSEYAVLYSANQGLSATEQANARANIDAQKYFITLPTSPNDGDVIKYDAVNGWTVGQVSGSPTGTLYLGHKTGQSIVQSSLADVSLANTTLLSYYDCILLYDHSDSEWTLRPFALSSLNDVDFSGEGHAPDDGYVLTYDSGYWIAAPSSGGGSGTDTWRPISFTDSSGTVASFTNNPSAPTRNIELRAGNNVTFTPISISNGKRIIISASGTGGSTVTWTPQNGYGTSGEGKTLIATIAIGNNSTQYVYAPSGNSYELQPASSSTLGGVKIQSGSGLTIDQNGNLSLSSVTPTPGEDSWRPIKLYGTSSYGDLLGSGTTSGYLGFKAGTNISITTDTNSSGTGLVISNTYTLPPASSGTLGGVRIQSDSGLTIDGNGNLSVTGGTPTANTWRAVQVNGVQKLGTATTTGVLNIYGSCVDWDNSNSRVTITAKFGTYDSTNHIVPVTLGSSTLNLCVDGYSTGGGGTGVTTLAALTDVDVSSKDNGYFLRYSTANGLNKWVATTAALNDLSNVSGSASSNQFLQYNGTNWTPHSFSLSDLPSSTTGKTLYYGSSGWETVNYALSTLIDTSISGSPSNKFLKYSNGSWIDSSIVLSDLPSIALNDLSDVVVSSGTGVSHLGKFLRCVSGSGGIGDHWEPAVLSSSDVAPLIAYNNTVTDAEYTIGKFFEGTTNEMSVKITEANYFYSTNGGQSYNPRGGILTNQYQSIPGQKAFTSGIVVSTGTGIFFDVTSANDSLRTTTTASSYAYCIKYNNGSSDKELHIYCGTKNSANATVHIHGGLIVDGDITAGGEVTAGA